MAILKKHYFHVAAIGQGPYANRKRPADEFYTQEPEQAFELGFALAKEFAGLYPIWVVVAEKRSIRALLTDTGRTEGEQG